MASNGVQDSKLIHSGFRSVGFSRPHHMHKSAAMMHKGLLEGRPMMNCQWLAAYFNLLLFTMLSSRVSSSLLRIKCIRNVSSDCVFGTCSDWFGRRSKSLLREYWEFASSVKPKMMIFMKIACKWNLHWKVFIGCWPVGPIIVMTACWTSAFNAVYRNTTANVSLPIVDHFMALPRLPDW